MIDAVLLFGALNMIFETVLLCMLAPRTRLRVLGSDAACRALHVAFLGLNLAIHWGTLIGTTSAVLAFCGSLITVKACRLLFGTIANGRFYTTGLIRYTADELR
ncbi:hypothetical protein [Caldimonas sp. KR1-144]|uniref:hypothetical protein n=1 Tax=Caldimonas sp. KR1-144 TaxID=3400911 RepID=UPI003C0E888F